MPALADTALIKLHIWELNNAMLGREIDDPNDPRHGTITGFNAHIRAHPAQRVTCSKCLTARAEYQRLWRLRKRIEEWDSEELAEIEKALGISALKYDDIEYLDMPWEDRVSKLMARNLSLQVAWERLGGTGIHEFGQGSVGIDILERER